MKKRILSIVLTIAMALTVMPVSFAAETKQSITPELALAYWHYLDEMVSEIGISDGLAKGGEYTTGLAYARVIDFDKNGVPELYTVKIGRDGDSPVATEQVWKLEDGEITNVYENIQRSDGSHVAASNGRKLAKKDGKYYLSEVGSFSTGSEDYTMAVDFSHFKAYAFDGSSFEVLSKVDEKRASYMDEIPEDAPEHPYEGKDVYSYNIEENGSDVKSSQMVVGEEIKSAEAVVKEYLDQYEEVDDIIGAGSYISLTVKANDVEGLLNDLDKSSVVKYDLKDVTAKWKDTEIEELGGFINQYTADNRVDIGNFDYADLSTHGNAVLYVMDDIPNIKYIYEIGENIYLAIAKVKSTEGSEFKHLYMIVQKESEGFKMLKLQDEPIKEDKQLDRYVILANEESEFKFDYNQIDSFELISDHTTFLSKALRGVDGETLSNASVRDLIKYVEHVTTNHDPSMVKVSRNTVKISSKTIKDRVRQSRQVTDILTKILTNAKVDLNKEVNLTMRIDSTSLDWNKPVQVKFTKDILEHIDDADYLKVNLGESRYSIKINTNDLKTIGELTVKIEKSEDNTYVITFLNERGAVIDALDIPVTFFLPADHELTALQVNNKEVSSDHWGGKYDPLNRTIEFETYYSGEYTVITPDVKAVDIEGLTQEQQKAIAFLTAKGYLNLDGDMNFRPHAPLTGPELTKALGKMVFATSENLAADMPEKINRIEMIGASAQILEEKRRYHYPKDLKNYLNFVDNESVPKEAKQVIALAVREGLIDNGGVLLPEGDISRVDGAVILHRLSMLLYEESPAEVVVVIDPKIENNMGIPVALAAVGIILVTGATVFLYKKKKSA